MAKYLDPKADLTFKKVFGEHKDLLISFLNALLPLSDDGQITSIEYLPVELIPENPLLKDTIVDVRCKDQMGREFFVEMQMIWTPEFMKRVLYNASKSYSHQLDKGGNYIDLQPVYSLNLVNGTFRDDTEDCYHDYGIVDIKYKDHIIEGMHLIFIELPKFKPHSFKERKMTILWLRYLTEIDEKTKQAPKELLENPETRRALDMVEESAYSEAQLNGYDHFWDMVSTERTLIAAALNKGMKQGIEQGMQKGIQQGMQQGMQKGIQQGIEQGKQQGALEEKLEIAKTMKSQGFPVETIQKITGLTASDIIVL